MAVVAAVGAATFSLVQVYAEEQDVAPKPTWVQDDQKDLILVPQAPPQLDWSMYQVLADKPVRFALNADPDDASTPLAAGTPVAMPARPIHAGDEVRICGQGAQDDVTVWFVDPVRNEQVSGFFEFRAVEPCPAT